MARIWVQRSSMIRSLLRPQQSRPAYIRIPPLSSLVSPSISQLSHPMPLSTFTIPTAACCFSSSSLASRSYSSDSELPSNVVLVKSDDQLNASLQKAEDELSQAIFYYTAVWCGPCQFLWPDMKKLSEGLPNVKFYKIDIDEVGTGPTINKLNICSVTRITKR